MAPIVSAVTLIRLRGVEEGRGRGGVRGSVVALLEADLEGVLDRLRGREGRLERALLAGARVQVLQDQVAHGDRLAVDLGGT